jgi:hypothetical protein|tara:strand:- start:1202 stop:2641 length:1440 start_codon:yes stop_codon:yes gene_type:complete
MAVELETQMLNNARFITPAYTDIVIRAKGIPQNILVNKFNVKYVLILYINDTVMLLKAPPNPAINNMAYFKIDSIVQDFVETDFKGYDDKALSRQSTSNGDNYHTQPHSIHQIDEFAKNKSNIKTVYGIGAYEYSDTASGTIQQFQSFTTDVAFTALNAVAQHNEGFSTQDMSEYFLTDAASRFLSKFSPTTFNTDNVTSSGQKIQLNQYHTIAFLNGNYNVVGGQSEVTRMRIRTYSSDNVLIDTKFVDNTYTNGGAPFGDVIQYNIYNGQGNTEEGLLYFGCGTKQLVQLGFDMTNVAYYFVQALNVDSAVSRAYQFDIQQPDCNGLETIRLTFLNSLGAWDYYNFTKKSVRKQRITKSAIKQNYGHNSQYAAEGIGSFPVFEFNTYNQGTEDGGTRTYNVKATEIIEANTDFITEEDADVLEELFTSTSVFMQTGNIFEPVVVNETEYIKQTGVNDKLLQYFITIEKGHNTRVQRL